jgi:nitrogenase molybdenum-iron protein NifN
MLEEIDVDLIIGSSKAYKCSKAHGVPLLRIGFPIHDRFGAASRITLGYLGSRYLLNDIVNTFIIKKQEDNPVGYTYQ